MEEDLYERIGEGDLNPTYKDGQVYQHTDINNMLSILKTAVNENYYDIQRLENGNKSVGKANSLDGAALSRYLIETLQADDDKIPSSQQVKAYVDDLFATYSPPIRGVDYWTEEDQQQIADEVPAIVEQQIEDMGPLGFNLTGNYDDTITYHKFDVVYYQGSTYAAKIDTIGNLPTNSVYWDILAIGTLKQFTYDSVAEMKLDNSLEDGMYAQTVGYYEANDGGGAIYKITSEEIESDYQEELENGLYATLIIKNESINIKQLGAYGDGIHDDYNVLNVAFNNYKNIYIPNGTYLSNSLISVSNNNLYIKGESNSILKYPSEASSEITNNQCFITFSNSDYIKIENIKIDCGGTYIIRPYIWQTSDWNTFRTKRYLTYNGIRTNNCDHAIIENTEIYNCCVGIMSKDSCFQTFNNIYIHDTFADGIRIGTGCENSNITNCLFNNLGDDCVAILHEDGNVSENYKPKNIIVNNINGKDCFGAIITILSAENCHCYNSSLIDNKDFPIKLGSSGLGYVSKNCSIENVNVITSNRVEGDTHDSEANNIAHGIVSISGSTAHEQNNCILKDCIFESSNGDNKLYRIDGNGYIIDGCQFIGYACRTYNLSNLKMYNCVFRGNDGSYFNTITDSVIENCDFYNNKTYSWNTTRGLAILENENCIYRNVYAEGTSASDNRAISLYTGTNKGNIFFSSKYNLQPTIVNVTDVYSDSVLIFTLDAFYSASVFKLGQQVYWTNQDKLYIKKSTGLVEL